MTLIPSTPNGHSPVPPVSFAELFSSVLLRECQATIERVCNEAMSALNAAYGTLQAGQPEVLKPHVIPENAPRKVRRGGHPATLAAQRRNARRYVIPRMMMLDVDFGGNLSGDEVCRRFGFSRRVYHKYKINVMAIHRGNHRFGGSMNDKQTIAAAHISADTFYDYIQIMKEGFHA